MSHLIQRLKLCHDYNQCRDAMDDAVKRIEFLENQISCACNALTDSVCVSGNDPKTNLVWIKKLERCLKEP